jgi:hypothetical protein
VGTPGLVVCCRLNEYHALSSSLVFNGAIHLQSLSLQQIDTHLEKRGQEQAALRELLHQDEVLQDLARSPLMLDVMATAYQDLPIETLKDERLNTPGARQKNIFQTYVSRMFDRRGKHGQTFSREQTLSWMSLLAKNMALHAQGIFLIERIQPSWLSNRAQLFLYLAISRTAAGLLVGFTLIIPMVLGREPLGERVGAAIFILLWTFSMGFFAALLKIWQSRKGNIPNAVQRVPSRLPNRPSRHTTNCYRWSAGRFACGDRGIVLAKSCSGNLESRSGVCRTSRAVVCSRSGYAGYAAGT